ncbi:MAG: ornithine cyclodeaminase family protein [Sandaracinus sp.]|nr:ornithine cyclodeaminase family protein [Sandaracinus sp.]
MSARRTRILSRTQIADLAEMRDAVDAVAEAFEAQAKGTAQMPPKVYLDLPEHEGDFRAMPASMDGAAGVKWVNSHPANPARFGLPSVMGVYILSDPATAFPEAILDATLLTALRTGAAAGVASRALAIEDPKTVGFVGSGVQARFLLDAHQAVFGDGFEALFSDLDEARAESLAKALGGRAVSVEEASGADIVCTSTPSRTPVVQRAWLVDHAHVNAMGADAEGKQELESAILKDAQVFIDEREQATHSGEINVPLHAGELAEEDLGGTLGQVLTGAASADRNGLTVFDSTGLALQDLALARRLLAKARELSVGTLVDLVGA